MEITGENYRVAYDAATGTIICQGLLRLQGEDGYAPIITLLEEIAEQKPTTITLDLRGLEFLNSSGINMFSKFVISVRDYHASKLIVQGARAISWQMRSLKYFQRLLPELELELT